MMNSASSSGTSLGWISIGPAGFIEIRGSTHAYISTVRIYSAISAASSAEGCALSPATNPSGSRPHNASCIGSGRRARIFIPEGSASTSAPVAAASRPFARHSLAFIVPSSPRNHPTR
jgi:hypothetical protein